MREKIEQTVDFIKSKTTKPPKIGMITGTGLATVTERMTADFRLPYDEIPNFPRSTIEGHKGTLVVGQLAGKPMIALEGRFHLYEGYAPQEITFPVRVMAELGVKYLLLSSAAGGLNPRFETGDLMIVTDHINLTGTNPLMGPNLKRFGPRFPDMTQVYHPDLIHLAAEKALETRIFIQHGVYVGLVGPSLETRAETRFLKQIGADAVGMSTVSEAIVGIHCGMKISAIVVITNVNLPDCMTETSIEDVISTAGLAGSKLANLWEHIIADISI